ncbi:unnamed protein product [Didymodactylos carnosus]|uniref:Uncharacterized protein n=1 Tax=Didymodactylos carnosus TaxID=1234261 RepID=A0A8S2FCN9_9BILA|nr:unnamed protein product [Didymodactylos carnosus]CAF4225723.1 unnamed protein product [Didymodactylos carnosus]
MNVLKYATTHDLPPFILKFEEEEKLTRNRLPGAMHIKSFIQSDLWKAGLKFSGFSLIRPVGKRFKLYVNSREDYYNLLLAEKWPKSACDRNILIIKPYFTPRYGTSLFECGKMRSMYGESLVNRSKYPCEVNQNHRQTLNAAVKKAIEDGRIQATIVNSRSVPVPRYNVNEFPRLNGTRQAPWVNKYNTQQQDITNKNETATINNDLEMEDRNVKIFDEIRKLNESTDLKLNEMSKVIQEFIPAITRLFEALVTTIVTPLLGEDQNKYQILEDCKQQLNSLTLTQTIKKHLLLHGHSTLTIGTDTQSTIVNPNAVAAIDLQENG